MRSAERQFAGLLPCPVCGRSDGYTLHDGSTYRWWMVRCVGCDAELGECRSNGSTRLDAPKPLRCKAADQVWQEAGKHAQSLRNEIKRLSEWIAQEGRRTNICTRDVLGRVCDGCRCGKAKQVTA